MESISTLYANTLTSHIQLFSNVISDVEQVYSLNNSNEFLKTAEIEIITRFYKSHFPYIMLRHHHAFNFLAMTAILIAKGDLNEEELTCYIETISHHRANIDSLQKAYEEFEKFSNRFHEPYTKLLSSAKQNESELMQWLSNKTVASVNPPKAINPDNVTGFARLVLVTVFKPDLIYWAILEYTRQYTFPEINWEERQSLLIADIQTPDPKIPILIICGKNMDPLPYINMIFSKVDTNDGKAPLITIKSADQLCTKEFQERYEEIKSTNHTLIVCSIHLVPSSIRYLIDIYADITEKKTADKSDIHPNFKLILFTELSAQLPIIITKNSKKYGYQYKESLKDKIRECFEYTKNEELTPKQKKLVFALSMMHGMLIHRVKYSFVTWSSAYKYTKNMFECGSTFLLEHYNIDSPNLEQILTSFCDASYGGIIKDTSDLNTLYSICRNYLNEKIFGSKYSFSSSEVYIIPEDPSLNTVSQQIALMPELEYGDLYNEGEFESIHFEKLHSDKIRSTISRIIEEPLVNEIELKQILGDIVTSLPPLINQDGYCETIKDATIHPGNNPIAMQFLIEAYKMNTLIQTIIDDIVVLTQHIEYHEFIRNELKVPILNCEVPRLWRTLSFPSSPSIINWLKALVFKADYIRKFLREGSALSYNLGGMINPFSFISAIRLHHMKSKKPFMCLIAELTNFLSSDDIIQSDDTFYVNGLLMIRGRISEGVLEDSLSGVEIANLPLVALKFANEEAKVEGMYECPVFVTQYREFTDDPSNYLMRVRCPTFALNDYWAVKGVAMLCSHR